KRPQARAETPANYDEIVKLARANPEFVSVGMMRAQKAAVAEFALTVEADVPTSAGMQAPKKATSRLVIPVNDALEVTIQRVDVASSARGTSWRGIVEETGENALLMWWKDGRISGVFAYKGHVYTIVNLGAD